MSTPLPPILPSSSQGMSNSKPLGSASGWNHAQSTSVGKLQQKKDREGATSSISRHIKREQQTGPTTSISHPEGYNKGGVTSVNDMQHQQAKRSVYDKNGIGSEEQDEQRYSYIQNLIRMRRAKMRAAVKRGLAGKSASGTPMSGHLSRLFKQHRDVFKGMSKEDKKYFENLMVKHAGAKTTGGGLTFEKRKNMHQEIEGALRSGKFSHERAQDFKKIVDKLGG